MRISTIRVVDDPRWLTLLCMQRQESRSDVKEKTYVLVNKFFFGFLKLSLNNVLGSTDYSRRTSYIGRLVSTAT